MNRTKNTKNTKLKINVETLRHLQDEELHLAAGGASGVQSCYCSQGCTRFACPPPKTPHCPI